MKKRSLLISFILVAALTFNGCTEPGKTETPESTAPQTEVNTETNATTEAETEVETETVTEAETETEPETESSELTLGSTFEFDDLEITLGEEIRWKTLKNQFSEHNGADVAEIDITITNLRDETHGLNMFYYTSYGSSGTKLSGVSSYFDGNVDFAGDMRSGATQQALFHILYDGDGDYYVEFDNWRTKLEVKIPIQK